MFAFLATAPDHSTSRMASISSPLGFSPGSVLPGGMVTTGVLRGQAKDAPEIRDILQVDVAIADHGDGHASAVNTVIPERNVVDGGKVGRDPSPKQLAELKTLQLPLPAGNVKFGLHSGGHCSACATQLRVMLGFREKIVERSNAGDDGSERGRNRSGSFALAQCSSPLTTNLWIGE